MEDPRPRVTVLGGFSAAATEAVARVLLVADPALVLVTHDISGLRAGVVRSTVRTADAVLDAGRTDLVHGCVSCTLRDDVLPTLARVARDHPGADIVLALPPGLEPETLAAAAGGTVRFDSFVTVVEAASFLADLSSPDDLRDRGLHAAANDHRAVADVVARQVEFADTLVVWDRPGVDGAPLDSLLHRLAPWAAHVRVGDTPAVDCTALAGRLLRSGRHDPGVPGVPARGLAGFPIGIHDPDGEYGISALMFRSRRPFHPGRLHAALGTLTGEPLRGRGQLWIASQPDVVIGWQSTGGGILLGPLGRWLAAVPRDRWAEVSPLRALAADLDWDPYYGDRRTVLSFVGIGLEPRAITGLLGACLLTDTELSAGEAEWRRLPDPFAGLTSAAGAGSGPA